MPRPKNPIRSVPHHLHIPEDVYGEVSAILFSPLEGKVPHGAMGKLVTDLLRDFLKRHREAREQQNG